MDRFRQVADELEVRKHHLSNKEKQILLIKAREILKEAGVGIDKPVKKVYSRIHE